MLTSHTMLDQQLLRTFKQQQEPSHQTGRAKIRRMLAGLGLEWMVT